MADEVNNEEPGPFWKARNIIISYVIGVLLMVSVNVIGHLWLRSTTVPPGEQAVEAIKQELQKRRQP